MRRLIAFIVLAASIVLGVMFNIVPELNKTHSGLDYTSGREFVYRLSIPDSEETIVTDSQINKLVATLEARLDRANVNRYKIIVEGNDQVRVAVHQETIKEYAHIKQLMNYNGRFELCTTDDVTCELAESIFKNSVARVDFKVGSPLPYVVLPISNKSKVENLRTAAQALDIGGEEGETAEESRLILWAGKDEGDTYAKAMSDDEDADKIKQKMLVAFNYTSMYFTDSQTELAMNISVAEEDQENPKGVANAVKTAQQYVNLLNAGSIDLKMEYLFDVPSNALVEDFINYGTISMISSSATVIAIIIAFVLIALLACLFYRLSGITVIVNLLSTIFISLILFNVVGMEFNIAALVGLLAITVASLIASIIYNEKLKEEVYKGRSLKKANAETIKRTLLGLVDVNVILLVISGCAYFLGTGMIQSFGVVGAIGAVVNFILNITLGRLLMWLLTNDTSLQQKQNLLGIRKDLIPDLKKEEKQQYYGTFAEKDFTAKAKKNGLIAAITTGVFAVSMLLIGIFSSGVFAKNEGTTYSRAYIEVHQYSDNYDILNTDVISQSLKDYSIKFKDITVHEHTDDNEEIVRYYVVDLKNYLDADTMVGTDKNITAEDALSTLLVGVDHKDTLEFRQVREIGDQPSVGKVFLALGIAIAITVVYFALRYNVIRALSSLILTVGTTFITLAFFSVTRIATTSATMLCVFNVALISLYVSMLIAERQKATKDAITNGEDPRVNDVKALSFAAMPALIISLVVGLISLNFLALGPQAYMTTFAGMLLGSALALTASILLFLPLQHGLSSLISPLTHRKNKEVKSEEVKRGNIKGVKSSEPEESIFIGIND